jgi:hypothetical protein
MGLLEILKKWDKPLDRIDPKSQRKITILKRKVMKNFLKT